MVRSQRICSDEDDVQAMAASGVLFENAHTVVPLTLPATLVDVHGNLPDVSRRAGQRRLLPGRETRHAC